MSYELVQDIRRRNLNLNGNTRSVLRELAEFANDDGTQCFPSQATLAQLLDISKDTVKRALKMLRSIGLIVSDGWQKIGSATTPRFRIDVSRIARAPLKSFFAKRQAKQGGAKCPPMQKTTTPREGGAKCPRGGDAKRPPIISDKLLKKRNGRTDDGNPQQLELELSAVLLSFPQDKADMCTNLLNSGVDSLKREGERIIRMQVENLTFQRNKERTRGHGQ